MIMKEKNDVQILCQNIKFLRQKYKLSKNKMAQILGVSVKTLNCIENGNFPPRMSCEILLRIQHHFAISPRQLFIPIEDQ